MTHPASDFHQCESLPFQVITQHNVALLERISFQPNEDDTSTPSSIIQGCHLKRMF